MNHPPTPDEMTFARADAGELRRFYILQGYAVVATGICLGISLAIAAASKQLIDRETPIFIFFGAAFGQIGAAAAWTVLGDDRLLRRVVTTLFAWIPASIVLFLMSPSLDAPAPTRLLIFYLFLATPVLFAVLAIPFLAMRLVRRMRVSRDDDDGGGPEFQFSMREMFFCTTTVALLLGVARWLLGLMTASDFSGGGRVVIVFGLFMVIMLLIVGPTVWAILSDHWRAKTVFAGLLLLGVTVGETFLFAAVLGRGPHLFFFAVMNVMAVLTLAAHLLTARHCGYRLRRSAPV